MAINFPGPYEIRIFYTCTATPGGALQHEMRLNMQLNADPDPGETFENISVVTGANLTVDLDVVVEEWLTTLAPVYSTSTSFDFVELWHYPTPQSFESEFVSVYSPTVDAGSAGGNTVPASQGIYTFRTLEGGIMKVSTMETTHAPAARQTYPNMGGASQDIVDYVLEGGSIAGQRFLARDTSYPFASIAYFAGQNEALFKQRYR